MKRHILLVIAIMMMVSCSNKEQSPDATGTFEGTEVTVSAQASGELIRFDVSEGSTVSEGDIVGQIDDYQLRLKRSQLETSTQQLEANRRQLSATRHSTDSRQLDLNKQLAILRQQLANQRQEYQRYSELVADGAVPRKQLDEIGYQIKVLEKQIGATEDQIASTNASLADQSAGIDAQIEGIDAQQASVNVQKEQVNDQIAHAVVKSPLSGTVMEKYVERGELVASGKPLFKVGDMQNMYLRAYVTSAQLKDVKVGQKVTVATNYGGGERKEYAGTVTWISSSSEFTPKTIVTDDERADLVYAIKVAVKNDGLIKTGMYGEVKF